MTGKQQATLRRLGEHFEGIALGHRTPALRTIRLYGAFDAVLAGAAEEMGLGLVAVQRVPGRPLLPAQINLLRSCK